MTYPPEQRARVRAFWLAIMVENLAVSRGEKTPDEAVESLCERFFPSLVGVKAESPPQPGAQQ